MASFEASWWLGKKHRLACKNKLLLRAYRAQGRLLFSSLELKWILVIGFTAFRLAVWRL